jgi:hypothetical protein
VRSRNIDKIHTYSPNDVIHQLEIKDVFGVSLKKKSIGGCGEPWQPQHCCALCSLPLLHFPGSVCFAKQLCLEPMFQKCYGLKVCKMLGKNNKRLWPWAFLGTKKMRAFTYPI